MPDFPEESLGLEYPIGWRDILTVPDAADYQLWLDDLSFMTREAFRDSSHAPDWVSDAEQVRLRWQGAIELIADATIHPEDKAGMDQSQIVEAGLLGLQANLENLEWQEEGISFIIPNIFTGEPITIDLKKLPSFR